METYTAEIKSSSKAEEGASVSIKADLPTGVFEGTIYGRGVADLSLGKLVTLSGDTNPESTGTARLCGNENDCRAVAATIQIPVQTKGTPSNGVLVLLLDGKTETKFFITPVVK